MFCADTLGGATCPCTAQHDHGSPAARRAFARIKPSRRNRSASGTETGSPRTPTRDASMSLTDFGSGAVALSPSQQRIRLLSKTESQNIEIQLKGIKLRLPAITNVRHAAPTAQPPSC